MDIEREIYVEKVPTGALVIITGDYIAVDKNDHELINEPLFMVTGDLSPDIDDNDADWKLVEAIDFAS